MELVCPRCQTCNQSNALFCQKCGTAFSVKPINPTRQNSLSTPIIVIVAVIAICGFCGIFGLLTGNKTEVAATNSTSAKSFISAVPTATPSPETLSSKTVANSSEPIESIANGAIVIAENANLRQTPDAKGEAIEMLAKDTKTEVIRQKGAWFYVRAAGKTGWLHGNTIRLAGGRSQQSPKPTTGESQPPYIPENKKLEEKETDFTGNDDDDESSSRYITGRRGGCYYINGNGNKTYVDRSMCGGTTTTRSQRSPSTSSSGSYIRGPRGGCYYINRNGNKTYVDRSLCN